MQVVICKSRGAPEVPALDEEGLVLLERLRVPVPLLQLPELRSPAKATSLMRMESYKADCRGKGGRRTGGICSTVGQATDLPCRHSRNERRQNVGSRRHGVSVQRAFDPAGGVDDQMVHMLGQELQNSGVHGRGGGPCGFSNTASRGIIL